jgi:hypothetical protein
MKNNFDMHHWRAKYLKKVLKENTELTEYNEAPDSLIGLVEEYLDNSGLDGDQILLELDELSNYCNERIFEIQQELEG